MVTLVHTESGSVYRIRQDGDRFFLSGKLVISPHSAPLEGEQEINFITPWPPIVGKGMVVGVLTTERLMAKHTSAVQLVETEGGH